LKDVADHHYHGFPQAGIRVVPLQNPAYRKMLKLTDDDTGARVDTLLPIASTEKVIQPDDVLLSIGDYPVASDGTILYQGNRLSSALAFQFAQEGDSVPLKIWRDGKAMDVSLPLHVYRGDHALGYQYDGLPRYYVHAGLVFTPLSVDYLRTLGQDAGDSASSELIYELRYHPYENPATARPEPIVLASVLADAVNANVGARGHALVDQINGIRINKLEDVIRAFETSTNVQDEITFEPNQSLECLDREEAAKANDKILKTYGLPKDRRL
jgi:hypothetical protein